MPSHPIATTKRYRRPFPILSIHLPTPSILLPKRGQKYEAEARGATARMRRPRPDG